MDKEFENIENFENSENLDCSENQDNFVEAQALSEENLKSSLDVSDVQSSEAVENVVENIDIKEGVNNNNPNSLITVRPVQFQEFEKTEPNRAIKKNLDILQDIQMHVSVELGKSKMSIKEVMEMEKGSVVELDKIAGEQVEIYVNQKLVARGEVIVIEDKFGVRVVSTNLPKPTN